MLEKVHPAAAAGICALGIGSTLVLVLAVVRPAVQMWRARGWTEQTCTGVAGRFHASSDNQYGVQVVYRWETAGRTCEGTRYAFMPETSRDFAHWQSVANEFASGKTVRCYVDVADPCQAVILRESWGDVIFAGAICGLFAVMFGLGTVLVIISAIQHRFLVRRQS